MQSDQCNIHAHVAQWLSIYYNDGFASVDSFQDYMYKALKVVCVHQK